MLTVLKMVVSALVIGGVNILARANPQFAGWIAALPFITFLSIVWLMVDHRDNVEITVFITGVLYGLLPSAVLLCLMIVLLGRGMAPPFAMVLSMGVWAVFTAAAMRLGLFDA